MAGNNWRFVSAALLTGALLAGCGGGENAAQDPGPGSAVSPPTSAPAPTTPAPGTGTSTDAGTPPTVGIPTPDPAAPPANATGLATLQWNVPTEFTDGSLLPATEVAGFGIFHGENTAEMTRVAEVDARATSLTVKDLTTGTHYFAVAAISASGEIGEMSEVLSKTVM